MFGNVIERGNGMTNIMAALVVMTNLSSMSVAASSIGEIWLAEGGRMTRPVEAVCIVTNVTQWNNEERSPLRSLWAVGEPLPGSVTKEMTEKTETTEVVEVRTLKFSWEGEEYTAKHERVLSRKVKRWIREDNWKEQRSKPD